MPLRGTDTQEPIPVLIILSLHQRVNNTSTPQCGQSTNASVTPDGKSIMKPLEHALQDPLIPLGFSTGDFFELGRDIPPLLTFILTDEFVSDFGVGAGALRR
jgi:hypothetical protein|tara:strand:+ start:3700 stop:4005 length:306 start_codon:yes stop_codon:yes gene_type:complete